MQVLLCVSWYSEAQDPMVKRPRSSTSAQSRESATDPWLRQRWTVPFPAQWEPCLTAGLHFAAAQTWDKGMSNIVDKDTSYQLRVTGNILWPVNYIKLELGHFIIGHFITGHFITDTLSRSHFTTRTLYHAATLSCGHLRTRTFYHKDSWTQKSDILPQTCFHIIILYCATV